MKLARFSAIVLLLPLAVLAAAAQQQLQQLEQQQVEEQAREDAPTTAATTATTTTSTPSLRGSNATAAPSTTSASLAVQPPIDTSVPLEADMQLTSVQSFINSYQSGTRFNDTTLTGVTGGCLFKISKCGPFPFPRSSP